jgi:YggT family protein
VEAIIHLVGYVVELLGFAIFARAIITWFPIDRDGPIVRTLNAVTDPILDPLRRFIPPIGMIDLTPMIAIIVLFTIGSILTGYSG